jgi:uncharacterized protein YdeI (YjbR/CyaY-like superfamily)
MTFVTCGYQHADDAALCARGCDRGSSQPVRYGIICPMATVRDEGERVHLETVDAWSDWLERNHERDTGVWLVSWRTRTRRPAVGYDEAVTEALRFGWIDSKGVTLDDDRTMQWFSPRRRGSAWARSNKRRIARLEAQGRLEPAGRALVESAKADGTWTLLDAVEDLIVPDDLATAFDEHPGSREQWDTFPPSARRAILEWIVLAKRDATRAKRVAETARLAANGERANQRRDS